MYSIDVTLIPPIVYRNVGVNDRSKVIEMIYYTLTLARFIVKKKKTNS